MNDLDFTSLRLFVAVCEHGNIQRAARQSHIVGSAVSKRLVQMEELLGTPLLLRRRHGVVPTPAGESLLQHARAMLAHSGQIVRDMAAFAQGVRGQVSMLASASALAESLAEDVAGFLARDAHRDILVNMEERISPDIVRGVQDGVASLGVCWDAVDLGGLQARPYRSDHLAIVMHARHPLAPRDRLTLADTLDHDHVSLPLTSAVQTLLRRQAAVLGRTIRYRVTVSNFEAALRVVRANLALSVVPREVAEPYASVYGLRLVPLDEPWAQRRFVVCFRQRATLSQAALMLLDHLCAVDSR
jgi:DNA-binding transcriptional LysR family regulator